VHETWTETVDNLALLWIGFVCPQGGSPRPVVTHSATAVTHRMFAPVSPALRGGRAR